MDGYAQYLEFCADEDARSTNSPAATLNRLLSYGFINVRASQRQSWNRMIAYGHAIHLAGLKEMLDNPRQLLDVGRSTEQQLSLALAA